jgi:hypothetical protein
VGVEGFMNAKTGPASRSASCIVEASDPREDLVRRVAASITFQKSPKLREFLLYVCRCAIDVQPAAATEQQVGINVFRRPPGYNPNDDNIVRSQARLLRLKLEHHFANEGREEPVIITIPKGRYLPAFEMRAVDFSARPAEASVEPHTELHLEHPVKAQDRLPAQLAVELAADTTARASLIQRNARLVAVLAAAIVLLAIGTIRFTGVPATPKSWLYVSGFSGTARQQTAYLSASARRGRTALGALNGERRILAGRTGEPFTDVRGEQWDPDEFYGGGVSRNSSTLLPPASNADLFKTIREGASDDSLEPQNQSQFRYDIPVPPGVYELRLYFADPVRNSEAAATDGSQNLRHFRINLNGRPLLSGFDAIADAGSADIDVRAFKNVSPGSDGQVHLEFVPDPERPFVSALELTPGTPGKLNPIRIAARKTGFVDADGLHWSADNYFTHGRTVTSSTPDSSQRLPELYSGERIGNFSYAIPVPPGHYTLKLHFLEGFFGSSAATGMCSKGTGCRVFDVSCNGSVLLRDLDIYQAAGGTFRPVVRTFHGLQPNGQGKLLIAFSPKVNYAEVRAIEVIDEGK